MLYTRPKTELDLYAMSSCSIPIEYKYSTNILRVYYRTHDILSLLTIRELPDFAPRVTPGILYLQPTTFQRLFRGCAQTDCRKVSAGLLIFHARG